MRVSRSRIIIRGMTNRCPNCGRRTLFQRGRCFTVNRACPACGLPVERDEGSFLGALSLNYSVTILIFLVPVLLLHLGGHLSGRIAAIIAGIGAIFVPMLLYRASRSWWLMIYYLVLPQHLPLNQRPLEPGEDPNT